MCVCIVLGTQFMPFCTAAHTDKDIPQPIFSHFLQPLRPLLQPLFFFFLLKSLYPSFKNRIWSLSPHSPHSQRCRICFLDHHFLSFVYLHQHVRNWAYNIQSVITSSSYFSFCHVSVVPCDQSLDSSRFWLLKNQTD